MEVKRKMVVKRTHTFIPGLLIYVLGLGIITFSTPKVNVIRDTSTGLALGIPLSMAGMITLFWMRTYHSDQTFHFQCVGVIDDDVKLL